MYCYVYDEFVQSRRHHRELTAIENRLTDLGLQGESVRLAMFRDSDGPIKEQIKKGAKTIVVIGNDASVHRVANVVVETGVLLALIPVGSPTVMAKVLGIPRGMAACDTLSQRIVEQMDVGRLNGKRFFTGVSMPNVQATVQLEDGYSLHMDRVGTVEVQNLAVQMPRRLEDLANPIDGKFDVRLLTSPPARRFRQEPFTTSLQASRFNVTLRERGVAIVDGVEVRGQEFHFEVETGALKTIVGRKRMI